MHPPIGFGNDVSDVGVAATVRMETARDDGARVTRQVTKQLER